MNNTNTIVRKIAAVAVFGLLASCSIDRKYDLSKDIDLTVTVGEGLSIPLGSTEKIMLAELLDPEESDILAADSKGSYSIEKGGNIDATSVTVDKMDPIAVEPYSKVEYYDLQFEELTKLENLDSEREKIIRENIDLTVKKVTAGTPYQGMTFEELPSQMQKELEAEVRTEVNKLIDDALNSFRSRFSLIEKVEGNLTTFSIKEDGIPDELESISKIIFSEPVLISVGVKIAEGDDHELFELVEDFELVAEGLNAEKFYVEIPEYIVLQNDDRRVGDKVYLDGVAVLNNAKDAFAYNEKFYITELDFTKINPEGLKIENGLLEVNDELYVQGVIRSNDVWLTAAELVGHSFKNISFVPEVTVAPFEVKEVVGVVAPKIDPIEEVVNIELGDGLDFIYDAELDFLNPQLFVTIENGSPVPVRGSMRLIGKDENGARIEGAEAAANLQIAPFALNRMYLTSDCSSLEGYTSVAVDGLKELLRKVPHSVELEVNVEAEKKLINVVPGSEYNISGNYNLVLPLEFEKISLEYTETIEDVFGDDADEFFEKVSSIEAVKIAGKILNTVPVGLNIDVKAYDASGKLLRNVVAEMVGAVAAGNGYVDGVMAAPAESAIDITLSAGNGELEKIRDIELVIKGEGSGVFNSNEYIQISELSLTVEEGIEVNLN